MKIEDIKTGYHFLQKPKPELKDDTTWAGPFILFFINIWNKIYKRAICPYTHSGTFVWIGEDLYIFEAIEKGFKRMLFSEKIKEVSLDRLLILVPQFKFDNEILYQTALLIENTPYDFRGLTISEGIYELTDERLWIGSRNVKKVFCIKACAYLIFKSTHELLFQQYYDQSPNDFYITQLFKHELINQ